MDVDGLENCPIVKKLIIPMKEWPGQQFLENNVDIIMRVQIADLL